MRPGCLPDLRGLRSAGGLPGPSVGPARAILEGPAPRSAGLVTVTPSHPNPDRDSFIDRATFTRDGNRSQIAAYWLMRDPAARSQWMLYQAQPQQVLRDVMDSVNAIGPGSAPLPEAWTPELLERIRARLSAYSPPQIAPPMPGPADATLPVSWLKAALFLAYGGNGTYSTDVVLPDQLELPEYRGDAWELPEAHEVDAYITHNFTGAGIDPLPFAVLRERHTVPVVDVPPVPGGSSSGGGGLALALGGVGLLWLLSSSKGAK